MEPHTLGTEQRPRPSTLLTVTSPISRELRLDLVLNAWSQRTCGVQAASVAAAQGGKAVDSTAEREPWACRATLWDQMDTASDSEGEDAPSRSSLAAYVAHTGWFWTAVSSHVIFPRGPRCHGGRAGSSSGSATGDFGLLTDRPVIPCLVRKNKASWVPGSKM